MVVRAALSRFEGCRRTGREEGGQRIGGKRVLVQFNLRTISAYYQPPLPCGCWLRHVILERFRAEVAMRQPPSLDALLAAGSTSPPGAAASSHATRVPLGFASLAHALERVVDSLRSPPAARAQRPVSAGVSGVAGPPLTAPVGALPTTTMAPPRPRLRQHHH